MRVTCRGVATCVRAMMKLVVGDPGLFVTHRAFTENNDHHGAISRGSRAFDSATTLSGYEAGRVRVSFVWCRRTLIFPSIGHLGRHLNVTCPRASNIN